MSSLPETYKQHVLHAKDLIQQYRECTSHPQLCDIAKNAYLSQEHLLRKLNLEKGVPSKETLPSDLLKAAEMYVWVYSAAICSLTCHVAEKQPRFVLECLKEVWDS